MARVTIEVDLPPDLTLIASLRSRRVYHPQKERTAIFTGVTHLPLTTGY
jgi:hypothetical protein